jgi:hypothetical protein
MVRREIAIGSCERSGMCIQSHHILRRLWLLCRMQAESFVRCYSSIGEGGIQTAQEGICEASWESVSWERFCADINVNAERVQRSMDDRILNERILLVKNEIRNRLSTCWSCRSSEYLFRVRWKYHQSTCSTSRMSLFQLGKVLKSLLSGRRRGLGQANRLPDHPQLGVRSAH